MADDADFWERLTKGGIAPDSATAIVKSHRGMSDADLWERIVKSGATPESATQMVQSRGGTTAPTTPDDTSLSLRNIGRSVTQGATFGWGDELGLTDRAKEKAFKAEHPIVDFLSKMGGGVLAPAAAVMAAPALGTTLGGAALLGGTAGLLSGAGEAEGGLAERAKGGAIGGLLGSVGGAAGYGVAKGAGAVAGTVLDRMHPERAVARAASKLIDPSVAARLALVDGIAPGGASIATATVPRAGEKASRLLPMLRAVGASPEAGASAEGSMSVQQAALDNARSGLGAKMDAIQGRVPLTRSVQRTMGKVSNLIASHTPEIEPEIAHAAPAAMETAQSPPPALRDAINDFWSRPGVSLRRQQGTVEQQMARRALERHSAEDIVSPALRGSPALPTPEPTPEGYDVQDLRDALSRLKFMERQMAKRGVDAPGMTLKDISDARSSLQSLIYEHHPEFQPLDKDYAVASEQLRQTDKALKTIQRSRANYQANDAYGSTSGSLGGSLPSGRHGVTMHVMDKLLTNKAGAADAVARLIAKPGGPEMVQNLLNVVPKASTGRGSKAAVAGMSAAIPAMKGLLFSSDSP